LINAPFDTPNTRGYSGSGALDNVCSLQSKEKALFLQGETPRIPLPELSAEPLSKSTKAVLPCLSQKLKTNNLSYKRGRTG